MGAEQPPPAAQPRPDGAAAFGEVLTVTGCGAIVVGLFIAVLGSIGSGPQYLIGGVLIVIAGLLVLVLKSLQEIQRTLSDRTTTSSPPT
jgi:hypothetical protein